MRSKAHEPLARRVWQTLFDLLIRSAPVRTASLARRGLTPNDSRALFSLDARTGRSMRSLADEWKCDPSNATFIVDRLEQLGLASRQPLLNDKRVKLVVLTRKGEKTRTGLLQEFHRPPAEFDRLGRGDLEALLSILVKLPAGTAPHDSLRTSTNSVRRDKKGRQHDAKEHDLPVVRQGRARRGALLRRHVSE